MLNLAGMVAANVLRGDVKVAAWQDLGDLEQFAPGGPAILLDVREVSTAGAPPLCSSRRSRRRRLNRVCEGVGAAARCPVPPHPAAPWPTHTLRRGPQSLLRRRPTACRAQPGEIAKGAVPHAVNVPLPQLRAKLAAGGGAELPPGKPVFVTCAVGLRGYMASRQLALAGRDVVNVTGGFRSWAQLKHGAAKL